MTTAAIPRWAWLILGIVAGAGAGHARLAWRGDDLSRYGVQIKGHARFQAALLAGASSSGAPRGLRHPVVYPEVIAAANGKEVRVQVVAGDFFGFANGADAASDGPARWRPAYSVVEPPYRGFNSATAYLDSLRPQGVTYRFAWWRRPGWWYVLHALLGAALVGGAWPPIVNLLTYGTWHRPAQEPAPVLPPSRPEPAPPVAAEHSTEEVDAMIAGLEDAASGAAGASPPPGDHSNTPTRPVPVLSSAPLGPSSTAAAGPPKEFGTDEEDFYPTELKAHQQPPGGRPTKTA